MLIVPLIDHIAGYSIDSDWFINLSDLDNAVSVGEGVKSALDYIMLHGRKIRNIEAEYLFGKIIIMFVLKSLKIISI